MSDLNYYAHPTPVDLPHRGGLIAWGVVTIVIGSFFALSGVGSLVIGGALAYLRNGSARSGAFVLMLVNGLFVSTMAAALIWIGIGCCRGRRWVRPLMLAGASVSLVTGVLTIVPIATMMVANMTRARGAGQPALPNGFTTGIAAVSVLSMFLLMIGLPGSIIAWFRRPSVGQTLAELDPTTRWTDAVPLVVLAWMFNCVWLGAGAAVAAVAGVWFWFKFTVTGWPAACGGILGLAIVIAGVGCYRRSTIAWATSVALFGLLAASAVTFVVAGNTDEYNAQMTERTNAIAGSFTPTTTTSSVATTAGSSTTTTTTAGFTTTTTTMTKTVTTAPGVTSVTVQPVSYADAINPQLAPAILYLASFGFGLWIRKRVIGGDRGDVLPPATPIPAEPGGSAAGPA